MEKLSIPDEVKRRRTFAIISHPDAGKTTLTEKLLLFSGAIYSVGNLLVTSVGVFALPTYNARRVFNKLF